MGYVPARGDVVWLTFNPQAGHEQAGRRPAVVLSPEAYNARVGLALFCPITSKSKGYPFEIPIPPGLTVTGVVLADQVKSLDWRARQVEFAARLSLDVVMIRAPFWPKRDRRESAGVYNPSARKTRKRPWKSAISP